VLLIRPEQTHVFEDQLAREGDGELASRLGAIYPIQQALLGSDGILAVVALARQRAREHGLRTSVAVGLYTGLVFQLGSDFDRDPQLPWASEILQDEEIPGAAARLELTCREAMVVIERIKGPRDEHLHAALQRLRQDPLGRPWSGQPPALREEPAALLQRIYPHKVELLVEQGTFARLLDDGRAAARVHHGTEPWCEALLSGLALLLGSGFLHDPQLPWVREALDDAAASEPPCVRLHRAAIAYLDRVMAVVARQGAA